MELQRIARITLERERKGLWRGPRVINQKSGTLHFRNDGLAVNPTLTPNSILDPQNKADLDVLELQGSQNFLPPTRSLLHPGAETCRFP